MAQGLRSHPPRQNPGRILLFVIKKSTMYNIFFIPIRQFGPPNPEELCAGRTVCVCDANPLDTSKHRLDTIPVGVELATHVTDRSPPPVLGLAAASDCVIRPHPDPVYLPQPRDGAPHASTGSFGRSARRSSSSSASGYNDFIVLPPCPYTN